MEFVFFPNATLQYFAFDVASLADLTPYQRVIDKGVPIKRSINHRGRSRSTSTTPRGT